MYLAEEIPSERPWERCLFPVLKSKKIKPVLQVNEDDKEWWVSHLLRRDVVSLLLLKSQGKGLPVLYYILPFNCLVAKGSHELKQPTSLGPALIGFWPYYRKNHLGIYENWYRCSEEKSMVPHSSTLAWKSHGWRSLVDCGPWGC